MIGMKLNQASARLWSKFQEMRMERKLLLVFLIVITLPLTSIGYISYRNYSQSIESTTVAYSSNLLGGMMERLDDYIEDMVRISSVPAYQTDIKRNLDRSNRYYELRQPNAGGSVPPDDFDELLAIQRGIESNIKFINNIKRGANTVYVFDRFGTAYFSSEAGGVRLNIEQSYREWMRRAEQSGGEALLFGTQKYTSNLNSEKYAFTVVRKLMDESLHPIGLIAVDASISVIEDRIIELDKLTHGQAIMLDENNTVIYDSNKKRLALGMGGDPLIRKAKGAAGSFYETFEGEESLVIYNTSPDTKWKVLIAIPKKELMKDSIVTRNVTWIATFVSIGLATLISIFSSFALTKPLRKMMRLMRSVQEGDFSVKYPVRHNDEIGMLGRQFNQMIVRIEQLISHIYAMESKKKEAELYALQTQINPHFMYNTLETIRMAAELNDDDQAADMLTVFGKLLRYSIGESKDEVPLELELAHVRLYVELLNYRYPNRFELVMDVPEPLRGNPLLKLVLQPIVENSIYHGLDDRKGRMLISLRARQEGERLLLRIEDDGIGMSKDTIDRLNRSFEGMAQPKGKRGGIGLKNVNERIKLHYGSIYGLAVREAAGGGTVIAMTLPFRPPDRSVAERLPLFGGDVKREEERN